MERVKVRRDKNLCAGWIKKVRSGMCPLLGLRKNNL